MKIKTFFIAFFAIALACCNIFGQDTIMFTDNTLQVGKVLEVNLKTIKFSKAEIENSPIYEKPIKEVMYIKYPGGYIDTFNDEAIQYIESSKKTVNHFVDTTGNAKIYFVFNYGLSEDQIFPLYINDHEICRLKNKSRLFTEIYSEGTLKIERVRGKKHGPAVILEIQQGIIYGIEVIINDPYGLDPSHRFHLRVYSERNEVEKFIDEKFYGFSPWESRDHYFEENISDPLIIPNE